MGIISGVSHYLIPRQYVLIAIGVVLAVFAGIFAGEQYREHHIRTILLKRTEKIKSANNELAVLTDAYKEDLEEVSAVMKMWKESEGTEQSKHLSLAEDFQAKVESAMDSLEKLETLLDEKERELFETKHELAQQENEMRIIDQELVQLADWIKQMAKTVEEGQEKLPMGLAEKYYFRDDFQEMDDDMLGGGNDYGDGDEEDEEDEDEEEDAMQRQRARERRQLSKVVLRQERDLGVFRRRLRGSRNALQHIINEHFIHL